VPSGRTTEKGWLMAKVVKRVWNKGKPNEKWTWAVRYQQNGKQHIKSFKTHKATKDWEAEVEHEKKQGVHTPESGTVSVKEAGDLWFQKCEQRGLKRGTLYAYGRFLNNQIYPLMGGEKLTKLTVPLVEAWCDRLLERGKQATVKKALTVLKCVLQEAQRRGLVTQNVARDVRIVGKKRRKLMIGRDVPTAEEAQTLMENAEGLLHPLIVTAVFTGMRAGELRALTWDDVDFERGIIVVRQGADRWGAIEETKTTTSDREIPMVSTVINTLREWQPICTPQGRLTGFLTSEYKVFEIAKLLEASPGTTIKVAAKQLGVAPVSVSRVRKAMPITSNSRLRLVFPSRTGSVRALPVISMQLRGLQRRVGMIGPDGQPKYSIHKLRHFFATWMIKNGCPIKQLQRLMGHATAAMTLDTYGHFYVDLEDDRARLAASEKALLGSTRQKSRVSRHESDNILIRLGKEKQ
jgi:integrase